MQSHERGVRRCEVSVRPRQADLGPEEQDTVHRLWLQTSTQQLTSDFGDLCVKPPRYREVSRLIMKCQRVGNVFKNALYLQILFPVANLYLP